MKITVCTLKKQIDTFLRKTELQKIQTFNYKKTLNPEMELFKEVIVKK